MREKCVFNAITADTFTTDHVFACISVFVRFVVDLIIANYTRYTIGAMLLFTVASITTKPNLESNVDIVCQVTYNSVLSSIKNCCNSRVVATVAWQHNDSSETNFNGSSLNCQWQRFNDRNKLTTLSNLLWNTKSFHCFLCFLCYSLDHRQHFHMKTSRHRAQNTSLACDKFLTSFCLSYFHSFIMPFVSMCTIHTCIFGK